MNLVKNPVICAVGGLFGGSVLGGTGIYFLKGDIEDTKTVETLEKDIIDFANSKEEKKLLDFSSTTQPTNNNEKWTIKENKKGNFSIELKNWTKGSAPEINIEFDFSTDQEDKSFKKWSCRITTPKSQDKGEAKKLSKEIDKPSFLLGLGIKDKSSPIINTEKEKNNLKNIVKSCLGGWDSVESFSRSKKTIEREITIDLEEHEGKNKFSGLH